MVEAHDAHPISQPDVAGPIICSWWLKPLASLPESRLGVAGGYHSFAVKSLPATSVAPEVARCTFTCHMVLNGTSSSTSPSSLNPQTPTEPSSNITGFSIKQKILMSFHILYARILLDLAVGRLRKGAVGSEQVSL